jgi:hypothetical protein
MLGWPLRRFISQVVPDLAQPTTKTFFRDAM